MIITFKVSAKEFEIANFLLAEMIRQIENGKIQFTDKSVEVTKTELLNAKTFRKALVEGSRKK